MQNSFSIEILQLPSFSNSFQFRIIKFEQNRKFPVPFRPRTIPGFLQAHEYFLNTGLKRFLQYEII